jgi:hypothetical protein
MGSRLLARAGVARQLVIVSDLGALGDLAPDR